MAFIQSEFRAGWQTIDVTPPVGCYLAGYAARTEPATGVYRRLFATAAVIDDGGDPVILVSIEWLGFYDHTEEARRRISKSTGVDRERIVLTGTHTHAGPSIRELDGQRHGMVDEAYLDRTLDRIADAAAEAGDERSVCGLRFGTDWCGFAASRRAPDGKGGILWAPSLDAPHDHAVAALFLEREDNGARLVLFNYACHPTSTGPILQIGGDYPGFACDRVRDAFGPDARAAFLNGCGGDQKPGSPERDGGAFRRYSVEEVRSLGNRLGDAVTRAASHGYEVDGPIRVAQTFLTLESAPIDRTAVRDLAGSPRGWERAWAEHYERALKIGGDYENEIPFEVQTLQFGDSLAIVFLAGEMNVEYGLRLRRELQCRFGHAMIVGFANGIVGYVPVDRQIPEGGYEVIDNHRMLLRPGPFAEGTEEKIIRAVWKSLG